MQLAVSVPLDAIAGGAAGRRNRTLNLDGRLVTEPRDGLGEDSP